MNSKLLLKCFPVVLLTIVPVVGLVGLARSEVVVQQPVNQGRRINQLIQQLKSEDAEIRSSAAFALGRMSGSAKSAIPSLIPLLKDSDAKVRWFAVYALGRMGESARSAIPNLIPLLKDSDTYVRSSAAEALRKLGYKP